ncbi:hypothetical protein D9758_000705 [Tetrapyrgos nigripes]|uniref:SAC domain-containing protein n=1 Tax=Tetrapyrgos nigripes TaxID=182062 RepID=A0A8H5GYY6_9AGAR|nr:hypothetical protein D9758_000705 [Tetrapyrgos nigripes]
MKRLFSISKSAKATSTAPATAPATAPVPTPRLQPAYTVPPVPHPVPHEHISILTTPEGLLLRPYQSPSSYVRIQWSKNPKVQQVDGDGGHDWNDSVVVYGLVGILDLYSTSYLLAITGREHAGNLIESTHTVYTVKAITAIPLVHDRAEIVLNTLSSRNSRPSLLPSSTIDTIASSAPSTAPSTPKVQFSETDQIKVLTPPAEQAEFPAISPISISDTTSDTASDISAPDSSPASPVTKAVVSRLSFWSRLSKRQSSLFSSSTSVTTASSDPDVTESLLPSTNALSETQAHLETIIDESTAEPKEVLTSIINETAPATGKEFVRGGMYFAYTFDITRSLQHKQELIAKAKRQSELLDELLPPKNEDKEKNKSKDKPQSPTKTKGERPQSQSKASDKVVTHAAGYIQEGDKVDPLAEPNPTLPLWRRVDKQFWWNEWLSKPLIDAGLHSYILPLMQGYYQFAQFTLPPDELTHPTALTVDYILISRRSKDRAGLRYQRRGIDDEANVANFVESEMVMGVERGDAEGRSVFGYVQIRGSIPLFWTQNSSGLKPPPVLSPSRTHPQNLDVMRRHLERLKGKYVPSDHSSHSGPPKPEKLVAGKENDGGEVMIINLAEQSKTSKEAEVASSFGTGVAELTEQGRLSGIRYHEYDFHIETKGMKYENISRLVERMEKTFENQG